MLFLSGFEPSLPGALKKWQSIHSTLYVRICDFEFNFDKAFKSCYIGPSSRQVHLARYM